MELITRTARLVPYAKRPKQVPSFVMACSYSPAVDEATAELGSIFVVIEVLVSGRPGEDIANLISNTLQDTYYDSSSEIEQDAEPLLRFEHATKAINSRLSDYVNQGNAAWIGKLSAVLALQVGNELHISHTGSAEAFLYRHQNNTRITSASAGRPTGPAKTFGSIASGLLESGDQLLISTPALIHQLSLKKIHDVVGSNGPTAAIAELTELLKGSDVTRIACLIIETTTPELAALQVRDDSPSSITIGAPENALESAKLIAAPIAQATVATGIKATEVARNSWVQSQPHVRKAGYKAAGLIRVALNGGKVAKRAGIGLGVVVTLSSIFIWHQSVKSANNKLVSSYASAYREYSDTSSIEDNQKRRTALIQISSDLTSLNKSKAKLNSLLTKTGLPSGAPRTLSALEALVTKSLDTLDGVVKVSPTKFIKLQSGSNFKPRHLSLVNGNLYLIDYDNPQINVVNIATKTQNKVNSDLSKLGTIVSSVVSSANDGIYLLTKQNGVWLYKFSSANASQISLGLSGWESGSSISSYAGNLYILSGGQILKHIRTSTGFSPGTDYISGTSTIPSPSSLMVDGYVYVAGSDGLYQYLSGVIKSSVPTRSGLSKVSVLKSEGSNSIIGIDATSGHIAEWSESPTLSYLRQYQLINTDKISDADFSPATQSYYGLTPNSIVTFKSVN